MPAAGEEKQEAGFSRAWSCENANGCRVRLVVAAARHRRRFTIVFGARKAAEQGAAGGGRARLALAAAVALNLLAVLYAQVSLTALLVIASVLAALTLLWLTHSVQSESILVVPSVGIQSCIKYVHGREEQFIPWSSIEDVIINEVIHLNRVLYYLTVLVQDSGNTKLIPLFKYTKPRLTMLQNIYSEIQGLLQTLQQETSIKKGSGDI